MLFSSPSIAHGAICAASQDDPEVGTRDGAMLEAGTLTSEKRYAEARARLLWVLARYPDDPEAVAALARVDAWEGCWKLAEQGYNKLVREHPNDADTRGGLIDLLMWDGRYDEGAKMIQGGLANDPGSATMIAKQARLKHWQGDETEAVRLADQAEAMSPEDGDIRAMRDRMFLGEARVAGRVDHYPSAFHDQYSLGGQVLQRIHRYEVYGGVQLLERYGGSGTAPSTDLRYPVGVVYHPALGVALGAELAIGAPAEAIPNVAARVGASAPITTRVAGSLSYSLWHYASEQLVNLINPSVNVVLKDGISLDLRLWLAAVRAPATDKSPAQSDLAVSAGFQVSWSVHPRVDVAGGYTYGGQLELNPTIYQLLEAKSHTVFAVADILYDRKRGVRPLIGLERRALPSGEVLWIPSLEIGGYWRW